MTRLLHLAQGATRALACHILDVHTAYCRGWVHCKAYQRRLRAHQERTTP